MQLKLGSLYVRCDYIIDKLRLLFAFYTLALCGSSNNVLVFNYLLNSILNIDSVAPCQKHLYNFASLLLIFLLI